MVLAALVVAGIILNLLLLERRAARSTPDLAVYITMLGGSDPPDIKQPKRLMFTDANQWEIGGKPVDELSQFLAPAGSAEDDPHGYGRMIDIDLPKPATLGTFVRASQALAAAGICRFAVPLPDAAHSLEERTALVISSVKDANGMRSACVDRFNPQWRR